MVGLNITSSAKTAVGLIVENKNKLSQALKPLFLVVRTCTYIVTCCKKTSPHKISLCTNNSSLSPFELAQVRLSPS